MRPYHERFRGELRRGQVKKNLSPAEKHLRKLILKSDKEFWKLLKKTFRQPSDIKMVFKMEKKYAMIRPHAKNLHKRSHK
jgi:hypothetical protein